MAQFRFNSTSAALENAWRLKAEEIEPAYALSTREERFFKRIIKSREKSSWTEHDVLIATQLAKMHRQLEDMHKEIGDDYMVMGPRSQMIVNPLLAAANSLSLNIQSATRVLGLSASQRGASGEEQKKRNQAESALRKQVVSPSNTLLA